jgi:hypothetical protein
LIVQLVSSPCCFVKKILNEENTNIYLFIKWEEPPFLSADIVASNAENFRWG